MTTIEDRLTILETEFRTELRHLATKADRKSLELRMMGFMVLVGSVIISVNVAALRLWV